MVDKLREESGKLGANAVHIRTMEDPGTGERVVAAFLRTRPDRDSDAVALWCPVGRAEWGVSFDRVGRKVKAPGGRSPRAPWVNATGEIETSTRRGPVPSAR